MGQAFVNTLLYALLTVPVGVFLSLIVASLLSADIRGKGFFRTLFYIPVVSAPVAVAMVWKWLYNAEYGVINFALGQVGIPAVNWIADGRVVLIALAIIGIWSMIGYNAVILLGGLQGISREYYEAAEVDGAGPVRKFFAITLPLVTPTLFFVVVTTTIGSLQVFDTIYMIVGNLNPALQQAQSIVYLFYRYMFVDFRQGLWRHCRNAAAGGDPGVHLRPDEDPGQMGPLPVKEGYSCISTFAGAPSRCTRCSSWAVL